MAAIVTRTGAPAVVDAPATKTSRSRSPHGPWTTVLAASAGDRFLPTTTGADAVAMRPTPKRYLTAAAPAASCGKCARSAEMSSASASSRMPAATPDAAHEAELSTGCELADVPGAAGLVSLKM